MHATVPPVPEPVDSTIATHGAPGANLVQSRTNQGFPGDAQNTPQRSVIRQSRNLKLLIL
ncbi:hypothetical protein [Pandoraea apista]|uniref:hypothetical protein n=1 Tax=Pandoraea apista TaxID=93218 RepID=UPI0012E24FD2|nr:hypothetical protein [Pandoraea apista]